MGVYGVYKLFGSRSHIFRYKSRVRVRSRSLPEGVLTWTRDTRLELCREPRRANNHCHRLSDRKNGQKQLLTLYNCFSLYQRKQIVSKLRRRKKYCFVSIFWYTDLFRFIEYAIT